MRRSVALCLSLIGLVVLAGCGDNADSLIKRQIADMNNLADAIESDADEAKVKELSERLKETGEALQEMDISDEEKKRLEKKYGEEMGKAVGRVMKASLSKASGEMGALKGMMEGMGK